MKRASSEPLPPSRTSATHTYSQSHEEHEDVCVCVSQIFSGFGKLRVVGVVFVNKPAVFLQNALTLSHTRTRAHAHARTQMIEQTVGMQITQEERGRRFGRRESSSMSRVSLTVSLKQASLSPSPSPYFSLLSLFLLSPSSLISSPSLSRGYIFRKSVEL